MAGQAELVTTKDLLPETLPLPERVKRYAAQLYGEGHKRSSVAQVIGIHLYPKSKDPAKAARTKLRQWEKEQEFRDLIWDLTGVQADMAIPRIMKGITAKAIKGRVDAAKLVLEVTGRHTSKMEAVAPNIQINISGMPRPGQAFDIDQEPVELDE